MKHILTHILALFILLFFAGSRLLDTSITVPQSYAAAQTTNAQQHYALKQIGYKIGKETRGNYTSPSVEVDNSDLEISEQFTVLATTLKLVVFAFTLGVFTQRLKKRDFVYEATIRLFSRKYLVLRTFRI